MYHELSVKNIWSRGIMCNTQKQGFLWMWYEFMSGELLWAYQVVFTINYCLPSLRLWCCSVKIGGAACIGLRASYTHIHDVNA